MAKLQRGITQIFTSQSRTRIDPDFSIKDNLMIRKAVEMVLFELNQVADKLDTDSGVTDVDYEAIAADTADEVG